MAFVWGAWSAYAGGGNLQRFRVGVDYTVSGTRVTVNRFDFQAAYSIYKGVTVTRTGRLSGSRTVQVSTSGGVVSLGYGGSVTGSRGGSVTVGARVTNILHGLTCSVSVTVPIPALVPSKPARPTVSQVTSDSFRGSLGSAPASNGASIIEYGWNIHNVDSGGDQTATRPGRTWDSGGRSANTRYRIRVRARNSVGWGSYSDWSATFTTKPLGPNAPTNVVATRVNDGRVTVSWTRNPTTARPYTSQRVQRRTWLADGSWGNWVSTTVSGTSTSYTSTAVSANNSYQFRVVAVNATGSTASASSESVRTTPAAPSNVSAQKLSGGGIRVTFRVNSRYTSDLEHVLQDNPDGAGWVTVKTQAGSGALTHDDPNPSATHRYRVATRSTRSPALTSAWSAVSNIVQLQAPPNAPTLLAPSGAVDGSVPVTFAWRHNPVDTSSQTEAQVQRRLSGDTSWTTVVTWSGSSESYTTNSTYGPVGVMEYRVRTRGDHPDWSPWSAVGAFSLASRPTVAINDPVGGTLPQSRVSVTVGYDNTDGSPQARVQIELLGAQGATLETLSWAGTGDTGTFRTNLDDATDYTVRARVQAGNGLWSEWDEVSFTTDFPVPVPVSVDGEWDRTTGGVILTSTPEDGPSVYTWTGTPGNSASTRTWDDGAMTTNVAPNPRPSLTPPPLGPFPSVTATQWVVVDAAGEVLAGVGEDDMERPASLVKVMTCHVARLYVTGPMLDESVEIVPGIPLTSSNPPLVAVGDEISWRDLFYATLLISHNALTNVLAYHVGLLIDPASANPIATFKQRMLEVAASFGWEGNVFATVNGTGPDNRMTPRQVSELMIHIHQNDEWLAEVLGALEWELEFSGPNPRTVPIVNGINPDGSVKFPEYVGDKTGALGSYQTLTMSYRDPASGEVYAATLFGSVSPARRVDMRTILDYAHTHRPDVPGWSTGNNSTLMGWVEVDGAPAVLAYLRTDTNVGAVPIVRAGPQTGRPQATEGDVVKFRVQVKAPYHEEAAAGMRLAIQVSGATLEGDSLGPVTPIPVGEWRWLEYQVRVASGSGSVGPLVWPVAPSGGAVYLVRRALVQVDPEPIPTEWFDGDELSLVAPEFLTYQRRDTADSPWVTLAEGVDPESSIADPTPALGAPEYRVISHTGLPSSNTGAGTVLEWEHNRCPVYVSGDTGFSRVCRIRGHQVTDDPEIFETGYHFEGRSKRVAFFDATHEDNTVAFTGNILGDSSSRQEWTDLLRTRNIVVYRDCQGRKVFGRLRVGFSTANSVTALNLSVDERDHDENLIAAVDAD